MLKVLCRKKREKNVQRAKRRKDRNAYSSSISSPEKNCDIEQEMHMTEHIPLEYYQE